jgi:hypothetical protein
MPTAHNVLRTLAFCATYEIDPEMPCPGCDKPLWLHPIPVGVSFEKAAEALADLLDKKAAELETLMASAVEGEHIAEALGQDPEEIDRATLTPIQLLGVDIEEIIMESTDVDGPYAWQDAATAERVGRLILDHFEEHGQTIATREQLDRLFAWAEYGYQAYAESKGRKWMQANRPDIAWVGYFGDSVGVYDSWPHRRIGRDDIAPITTD